MVNMQIADQRLKDLLCCALEGGSNYWYKIERFNYPQGQNQQTMPLEFRHLELPFVTGGSLTISDDSICDQGSVEGEHTLDHDAMLRGLEVMREKYIKHYDDFMTGNEDADTGDVFLQCALFGEVVYA